MSTIVNQVNGLVSHHPDKVQQLFHKHHISASPTHRNMWLALRARKHPFMADLMSMLGGIAGAISGGGGMGAMASPGQMLTNTNTTGASIAALNPGSGGFQTVADFGNLMGAMGSFTGEESNATGPDQKERRQRLYNELVDGLGRYVNSKRYLDHRNRYWRNRPWEQPSPYVPYPYPYQMGGYNSNGEYLLGNPNDEGADASASAGVTASGSVDLGMNRKWLYILIAGLVLLYFINKK